MTIAMEIFPPKNIVFMRRVGENGEHNRILMQTFRERIKYMGIPLNEYSFFGINWDDPKTISSTKCRYDVAIIVDNHQLFYLYEDLHKSNLPSGKFAVILLPYTLESMENIWENFQDIIAKENCVWDRTRPIIERYRKKLLEKELCELCVPVE